MPASVEKEVPVFIFMLNFSTHLNKIFCNVEFYSMFSRRQYQQNHMMFSNVP